MTFSIQGIYWQYNILYSTFEFKGVFISWSPLYPLDGTTKPTLKFSSNSSRNNTVVALKTTMNWVIFEYLLNWW